MTLNVSAPAGEAWKAFVFVAGLALLFGGIIGYGQGVHVSNQESFEQGRLAGYTQGRLEGEPLGYRQGYEDHAVGRVNKLDEGQWEMLDANRGKAKYAYMKAASIWLLVGIFYWLPLILLNNPSVRDPFPSWVHLHHLKQRFADPSFRGGVVARLSSSLALIIIAWVFLPGYMLAQASSWYIETVSNELVVLITGAVAAMIAVWLIELSTTRITSKTVKFWCQIIWTAMFLMLTYQASGTLAAASEVNTALGIKMLLLQTGMAVGVTLYIAVSSGTRIWSNLRARPARIVNDRGVLLDG